MRRTHAPRQCQRLAARARRRASRDGQRLRNAGDGQDMTNAILTGLMLGGMYALIAMGLTLQYGVARIMNLAYGEILVAAAFACHWLFTGLGGQPVRRASARRPARVRRQLGDLPLLLTPLVRPRHDPRRSSRSTASWRPSGCCSSSRASMLVAVRRRVLQLLLPRRPGRVLGATVAANRLAGARRRRAARRGALSRADAHAHRHRHPRRRRRSGRGPARRHRRARGVGASPLRSAARWSPRAACWSACSSPSTRPCGVVFTMKALIVVIMGGVGNLLGALVAGPAARRQPRALVAPTRSRPDARRRPIALFLTCCWCSPRACSAGPRDEPAPSHSCACALAALAAAGVVPLLASGYVLALAISC